VLLLSLGFFVVSTYLLTNRFPRLFVYVQIMAFVVEGSSLPWLFNGLRGPSARTIDFWITAILLTFLGFVTAAAPRRIGRWVLRPGSADTAEDGQRALAFFAVGMLTLTVGLHVRWRVWGWSWQGGGSCGAERAEAGLQRDRRLAAPPAHLHCHCARTSA